MSRQMKTLHCHNCVYCWWFVLDCMRCTQVCCCVHPLCVFSQCVVRGMWSPRWQQCCSSPSGALISPGRHELRAATFTMPENELVVRCVSSHPSNGTNLQHKKILTQSGIMRSQIPDCRRLQDYETIGNKMDNGWTTVNRRAIGADFPATVSLKYKVLEDGLFYWRRETWKPNFLGSTWRREILKTNRCQQQPRQK